MKRCVISDIGPVKLFLSNSCRLQMLQQNMVGGEKANDEDAKEKRRRRKKHVDERKRLLARAARRDDEVIMLNVYDSIHDELKARDTVIARKDMEVCFLCLG